jgi:outer membrane protein assembly factor BamB
LGPQFQRGPAFDQVGTVARQPSGGDDWPTYRGDALRRGSTSCQIGSQLQRDWQVEFSGPVTPPVAAGGRLYLAEKETHRLCCLDGNSGQHLWDYTAGARIDSPPTIYGPLVMFGCRDGWVYAVRSRDGQLAWRRRIAPQERWIASHDQLESAWPVTGSVLMLDGVAYCVAGRSSYVDGGLRLAGLDPQTGALLYETQVETAWPDVTAEPGRPFDIEGTKSDILVTDGTHLFLYQMAFDKQLSDVTSERVTALGDRFCGRHLIATNGFLEDSWYDRTYWTYSNRWPGFYYANAAPKTGQILVIDDDRTYGLHVFTERARLSPSFKPGSGYTLFADDNGNEPVLTEKSAGREKGPGFSRAAPPLWAKKIPLRARAMVLAADTLFMAGPPDIVPADDPYAAFDGKLGAELWVVAASDGQKLAEYPLDVIPAFDGLIAAGGRLYMTTEKGGLQSWSPK